MYFQKEIETLPLEKLRKLQGKRLRETVHSVYSNVGFYRNKLEKTRVDPSHIQKIEDIRKLPFTYKNDLREQYPFGLFAVPRDEVIRIHASSGTTGKPTVVGYSRKDIETFAEVNARSLYAAGGRPGMKLHNAYGYGLFTGGLGLHYGGEKLGMAVIPVSGGMTARQLTLLQDFGAEMISCTPSYAQVLAEELRNKGISPDELKLRYAVLGAEPWTEAIRQDVEKGLGVTASNIYGLSEIIGPGVSQEDHEEKGSGSTIWEDHFYPEIINPETMEPVAEGDEGVLVFTTLTKEAMPLLRYWTNDITSLHYDRDSKRTHIKMAPIRGRADDMLIIRGVNLFPTQVEEVLSDSPEFSVNYQLMIRRAHALDELELRVELNESLYENLKHMNGTSSAEKKEVLGKTLKKKIKDTIGLSMQVIVADHESVPRSQGGKLNRVMDLRKN